MSTLNTAKLANMLRVKRGNRGLRAIADEIDVSAPTLSRVEQGRIPDVDTFIKICKWLEASTDSFIDSSPDPTIQLSNKERVVAHLRADRELNKDTVNMLINMINYAYSKK